MGPEVVRAELRLAGPFDAEIQSERIPAFVEARLAAGEHLSAACRERFDFLRKRRSQAQIVRQHQHFVTAEVSLGIYHVKQKMPFQQHPHGPGVRFAGVRRLRLAGLLTRSFQ